MNIFVFIKGIITALVIFFLSVSHVYADTAKQATGTSGAGQAVNLLLLQPHSTADPLVAIHLQSSITHVQPMTGIVFWADSEANNTNDIQLEYAYVGYNEIVIGQGQFNWTPVDTLLTQITARGHQAILRFYYTYPGRQTTVPQYIKDSGGYNETTDTSEGQTTQFPDWSFPELRTFTLDFFSRFAMRYDHDPRLAFLQTGFGLWGEYHIYDGPMILGQTFPSKAFQAEFLRHLDSVFTELPWNISIDAADGDVSPFIADDELTGLNFGLFDDSFLHETHEEYNADCFQFFNFQDRYKHNPMGGELSYYTTYDQRHALDVDGPYGISFEQAASQYHISYMIGNDQPQYQPMSRIKAAGMATGYAFEITAFKASSSRSLVTVKNSGIAPIYHDAFVSINGVRSAESLKGLLPGQSIICNIAAGGTMPVLSIESDRLVAGQEIEFSADL